MSLIGCTPFGSLRVDNALSRPRVVLAVSTTAADAWEALGAAGVPGAPATDDEGSFRGTVQFEDVAKVAVTRPQAPVGPISRGVTGVDPLS